MVCIVQISFILCVLFFENLKNRSINILQFFYRNYINYFVLCFVDVSFTFLEFV